MIDADLEKYCKKALEAGATQARQIHPSSVVTAAWVRWKCEFGCPEYGKGYCCPPHTRPPEETRALLDCYHRAILFHREAVKTPERSKTWKPYWEMMVDLEADIFKDGYYKAFVLLAGPCRICKECAKKAGAPTCSFGFRARPSMESCGIDVFQTARNNGFFIKTLKDRNETQNSFSLMLID